MTPAEIIEREFRRAVRIDPSEPVHVELGDEEITITSRCQVLFCDCDSDTDFIFIDPRGNELIFAIPDDWYSISPLG